MRNSTQRRHQFMPFFLSFLIFTFCHTIAISQGDSPKGYGNASYTISQAEKFMKTWLVAGPIHVSDDSGEPETVLQQTSFKTDLIAQVAVNANSAVSPLSIRSKEIKWQFINSGDDVVDLDSFYKRKDYAYAYALAEIKADAPTSVMLAVGSDDGIKIWHNGTLVHDNWIPRGVNKDEDLVPLKLVKGSNQIMVKVQDMQGGWGFVARILDKKALAGQLSTAATDGGIDKINLLINGGADVNAVGDSGITPIIAAKIAGRDAIVKLLKEKGALDADLPAPSAYIDAFYSSLKGRETSGIAVLVARDGEILYKKGFGFADIKNKIPATPDTKFRIGSVTKQFTAAAILKLQESNLISVNDKLSKFIPDFPRGDEVTIHQLLTHISGIHSYTNKHDFTETVINPITPDSLVNLIKKDPYDFNPGEQFSYNNSGYFLLGYIISKVSGQTYDEYLKTTFFDPLGMNNTGIHYAGIKLSNEAKGYNNNGSKYIETMNWNMSWAGAAGAIYSTVDDLLKWNQALYGGKVLNEKSMKAALTTVTLTTGNPLPMQYAYGLVHSYYRGQPIISHGGGLHGFITQLAYFPKEKLSVVMFSNADNPEVNFDPNKIAEAFLWQKMDKQASFAAISLPAEKLKLFEGRYAIANMGVLTITTDANKIFSQVSSQPSLEIVPYSENDFFWKTGNAQIKFTKDSTGAYTRAIVYQGGQEMHAAKLEEEKIIKVDPAVLDQYIGKYKFNQMMLVMTRENDKLFVKADNDPRQEMLATSNTDFVIKEINAKISFTKGTDGKVDGFKLNLNGGNTEVKKIE
jgi:CubicO group peptidase (beta-lactamase class C family)